MREYVAGGAGSPCGALTDTLVAGQECSLAHEIHTHGSLEADDLTGLRADRSAWR